MEYTLKRWFNPILRQTCREVEDFSPDSRLSVDIIPAMRNVLLNYPFSVGIAAPQVGYDERVVLADMGEGELRAFVNPKIIEARGKTLSFEGCLSFMPFIFPKIRSWEVYVKYQNVSGEGQVEMFDGFNAKLIQHEIDHLDGRTICPFVGKWGR